MLRILKDVSMDNPNGTGPKSIGDMSDGEKEVHARAVDEDREFRANRELHRQRVDALIRLDDATNEQLNSKKGK